MARFVEVFVAVNALCGIAAFLGLRVVFRRSKDATKRGFDIIRGGDEDDLEHSEKQKELTR